MAILTILAGGTLIGLRPMGNRTLHNASLQLQADMRYVQRRAVIEGRSFGIVFNIADNYYRIIQTLPERTIDTIFLPDGVRLVETSATRLMFLPRGTPSAGFRVILGRGSDTQRLTATVSGGRIRIFDINTIEYE